jgi:hypothetical protein
LSGRAPAPLRTNADPEDKMTVGRVHFMHHGRSNDELDSRKTGLSSDAYKLHFAPF